MRCTSEVLLVPFCAVAHRSHLTCVRFASWEDALSHASGGHPDFSKVGVLPLFPSCFQSTGPYLLSAPISVCRSEWRSCLLTASTTSDSKASVSSESIKTSIWDEKWREAILCNKIPVKSALSTLKIQFNYALKVLYCHILILYLIYLKHIFFVLLFIWSSKYHSWVHLGLLSFI